MIENVYIPSVGDWYKDAQGQSFEIVAVDEDEGSVEVQFYDGEIEEYDADSWRMLYLVPIAPPEDWTAPFDQMERDDLGYSDAVMRMDNWSSRLDEINHLN